MSRLPSPRSHVGAVLASASAAILLTVFTLRAAQQPPAAPAAKPLVPVTASSLLLDPDSYIGNNVAMVAAVERTLSKTAFSVDQDKTKATGKEVLVLAPSLTGVVEVNTYVTVCGEVVLFDPDVVARKLRGYTLDLPPDVIEKFKGHVAILATSVVNPALTDLAKRVAAPMTPAEVAYQQVMKQVSAASTALKPAVDGSNADQTHQQAALLKRLFGEAQAFFETRGMADASGWAQDGAKLADAIDQAAAGAKWDVAKSSSASLTQLCATCHAAHRERFDDGSFRVKG